MAAVYVLAAWLVASLPVALLAGGAIRLRDEHG